MDIEKVRKHISAIRAQLEQLPRLGCTEHRVKLQREIHTLLDQLYIELLETELAKALRD